MQYTTLGRTGLRVSRLGFGAMRLPMLEQDQTKVDRELAMPMIHRALDAGVNYVDTAVGYCHGDSQRVLGEALKGRRDGIVVSTKNHYYGEDEKEWWQHLEDSLERLQVSCIDIYNTHGVNAKSLVDAVKPRVLTWLKKAKDQGMIAHICTSFHDNNEGLRKVVDADIYDTITLQYNLLDRQLEDGIAYAHERQVGVIVMGPVGGGRLGAPNAVLSGFLPDIDRIPELALRFVLGNPNVAIALSGMSTMAQVEENLATASDDRALTADECGVIKQQLDRLKEMADLYCTGCGYCMPCPQGVNISRTFQVYNTGRVYGLMDHARGQYRHWSENTGENQMQPDTCTECGQCEEKCPQNILIREQLKEAHTRLAGSAAD